MTSLTDLTINPARPLTLRETILRNTPTDQLLRELVRRWDLETMFRVFNVSSMDVLQPTAVCLNPVALSDPAAMITL